MCAVGVRAVAVKTFGAVVVGACVPVAVGACAQWRWGMCVVAHGACVQWRWGRLTLAPPPVFSPPPRRVLQRFRTSRDIALWEAVNDAAMGGACCPAGRGGGVCVRVCVRVCLRGLRAMHLRIVGRIDNCICECERAQAGQPPRSSCRPMALVRARIRECNCQCAPGSSCVFL